MCFCSASLPINTLEQRIHLASAIASKMLRTSETTSDIIHLPSNRQSLHFVLDPERFTGRLCRPGEHCGQVLSTVFERIDAHPHPAHRHIHEKHILHLIFFVAGVTLVPVLGLVLWVHHVNNFSSFSFSLSRQQGHSPMPFSFMSFRVDSSRARMHLPPGQSFTQ